MFDTSFCDGEPEVLRKQCARDPRVDSGTQLPGLCAVVLWVLPHPGWRFVGRGKFFFYHTMLFIARIALSQDVCFSVAPSVCVSHAGIVPKRL